MNVINNTFFHDVKPNESTFLESEDEEEFVFRYLIVLINKRANTQVCIVIHDSIDTERLLLWTANTEFVYKKTQFHG